MALIYRLYAIVMGSSYTPIWGATASVHDSTAFKDSSLYQQRSLMMADHEYLLGNNAYQLDAGILF